MCSVLLAEPGQAEFGQGPGSWEYSGLTWRFMGRYRWGYGGPLRALVHGAGISGVISRVPIHRNNIKGRITPFITTHEPPSNL